MFYLEKFPSGQNGFYRDQFFRFEIKKQLFSAMPNLPSILERFIKAILELTDDKESWKRSLNLYEDHFNLIPLRFEIPPPPPRIC